jgi:hypothetical protein
MKKIVALLSFITLMGIFNAQAQDKTPVVDKRQENQHDRIKQGVASGELTRKEAAEARQDQRQIRRSERRAKADGDVTAKERARLQRKQNKASRELRREKHDAQDRPY